MRDFNIGIAIPYIESYSGYWAPSPWLIDHCGEGSPAGDSTNTKLRHIIADGTRWTPLYSPGSSYGYARSEISLTGGVFVAGNTYMIEWVGTFPQDLPPPETDIADWQRRLNLIFQVHNNNDSSPYYAFSASTVTKKIEVAAPGGPVAIADFSSFVNQKKNVRFTYKVSSGNDGYAKAEIDGRIVFERYGPTTPTPGSDYVKFGLYDWGRAIVSPDKGYRGRSFEMITQSFKVYRLP